MPSEATDEITHSSKHAGAHRLGMSAAAPRGSSTLSLTNRKYLFCRSVVGDGKTNYVLVVEQSKAVKRDVKEGRAGDIRIAGIKAGDIVIAAQDRNSSFLVPASPMKSKGNHP
jgi:hypothetical protein